MKTIIIDGVIGWDFIASDFRDAINEASGDNLDIQISSPGGSVFEGNTIYDLIVKYKKDFPQAKVTITSFGISASQASIIALAGHEHYVYENTVYVIHNAWALEIGDHRQMRKTADILEKLSNMSARVYAAKSGKTISEIKQKQDEETYFYGKEIADYGFADAVLKNETKSDKQEKVSFAKVAISETVQRLKNEKDFNPEEDLFKAAALIDIEMKVNPFRSNAKLVDESWDKSASETRWRDHADVKSRDDLPNSTYSKRFSWYDENDNENFGAYKFPIFDYKQSQGGEFVNISAVRNGLARLSQSDIPADDKDRVRNVLEKYLNKWKKQNDEESNIPASAGKNINTEVIMNLDDLEKNHPELYAQVVQIGKDEEFDRVQAHITMGKQSGSLDIAVKNIEEKKTFTQSVAAEYMAAGMKNQSIQNRKDDEVDTGSQTQVDDESETKEYTQKLLKQRGVKNVK